VSIVRIGLAPRAPGLTRRAAQQYWRSEHARLFAQLPGLLSYVQNHAVLDDAGEPLLGDPGFDIFAEVEFEDEATLHRVASSQHYRDVILADEKNLLDASRRTFLMTRRQVLRGAPEQGSVKVALFLGRGPTSSVASRAAVDAWLSEVAQDPPPALATVAYVVTRVGGTTALPVDLVLQHYFAAVQPAVEWHGQAAWRWRDAGRDHPRIVTAVVAAELDVFPRHPAPRQARVRA
jgi:uncharacterized protein (TIGR02118 family)